MSNKNIYKVFSNAHRVKLLRCLTKPKNVTELLSLCSFSQSALSQHLKVLRDAGVVRTKRVGKEIVYSVDKKEVVQIADLLLNFK